MTEDQRIARAFQAKSAWEIVEPMIDGMVEEYTARLIEVANSELNPAKRADKITALSNAIRIAENLRDGMKATIADGEVASRDKLRSENIEAMTAPRRRLLGIAPY